MSMAPYEYYYDYSYAEPAASAAVEGVLGFFAVFFGLFYVIMLGFSIACYVLNALGLYTTAKRRGIRNPWLSWIPIAEVWILGSLSDQYQYVKKGKIRNRRKVLLGLEIGLVGLMLVILVALVAMATSELSPVGGEMLFGASLAAIVLGYLVIVAVGVISMVFLYIAYYDYFTSCTPDNAVMYLVLSILIPVTLSFFVFFNRKNDLGMPPRKQEQPTVIETIAAEPVDAVSEDVEPDGNVPIDVAQVYTQEEIPEQTEE